MLDDGEAGRPIGAPKPTLVGRVAFARHDAQQS